MTRTVRAAITAAGLSALFLVVYPFCNWISSLRPHVGSICFGWERHLPFVPALIVPYMSIDLFFVASPFLARSPRELKTLTGRLASAILIAGACFLLFPLKFSFARPQVNGVLGILFTQFQKMDLPFNQCPSLHVAMAIILIEVYFRHTRRWLRAAIGIWFSLILISTVLTYQHQVIDVIGGFALAAFCFHQFPRDSDSTPSTVNPKIAGRYAAGSVILFILAFILRPLSLVLLWPSIALELAAIAYLAGGSNLFRKEKGILPWSTWLIFWPLLIGQRLSLFHYARQSEAYDRLTDRLWIGRRLSNRQASCACDNGVTAVIDLTSELPENKPFRNLIYLPLPTLDLTAPHMLQIDRAVKFIQEQTLDGIVYLHCKAGYSRTAVIAAAYLLASGRAETSADAMEMLHRARRGMIIRPEAVQAIEAYAATHRSNFQTAG